jgi:exonuclease VII large subunit
LEDDDDEYIEGEEDASVEEDETSLGWDSDSEEEEVSIGGDGNDEDDSIHDEVAFDSEPCMPPTPLKLESIDVVKLRRTLMHAESERNNMMLMVEERNEEINRLKGALEQKPQSDLKSEQETLDELETELKCLRIVVALKSAQATVNELKTKIDTIKTANDASSLSILLQEELSKQEILQRTINEYEDKTKQLESDEGCSRLTLQDKKTD